MNTRQPHSARSSAKTGMMPGSVVYIGENPPQPTTFTVWLYDNVSCERIDALDPDRIQAALESGKYAWVDVAGLADSEGINRLCTSFGVHPLIIEDILNTHQRPKIDSFRDSLFIVLKRLDTEPDSLTYDTEQCSMVVKQQVLLTFRETNRHDFGTIAERLETENSLIRSQGMDYLTYLLLDSMVDEYFNFVETTANALETLEDQLIAEPGHLALQSLYTLKRRNQVLRKIIAPIRDIVHLLLEEHTHTKGDSFAIYYRDLHDHCLRLLESVDVHREMITGMLELYHSTMNNRLNEAIKVLTLFASLFIPLTFIVGLYGMNFRFMPELEWRYGYPAVLILMAGIVVLMLYYFRRKKLL